VFSTFFTGSAAIHEDRSGTEADELHFVLRAIPPGGFSLYPTFGILSCCKCRRESFYSRLIVTTFFSEALLGSSSETHRTILLVALFLPPTSTPQVATISLS